MMQHNYIVIKKRILIAEGIVETLPKIGSIIASGVMSPCSKMLIAFRLCDDYKQMEPR